MQNPNKDNMLDFSHGICSQLFLLHFNLKYLYSETYLVNLAHPWDHGVQLPVHDSTAQFHLMKQIKDDVTNILQEGC